MNIAFPYDPLWTGLGLVAPLEARVSGRVPRYINGISIDTRTLEPGDLFFAIEGEHSDGHDYVAAAFVKGAGAAVVDEAHADTIARDGPLYIVHDVFAALRRLGARARARTAARIIGVTGSVGKTSTKEALRLVLTQGGETHASVASYNNHWGVPLTLARMAKTTQFGIFEIGMNHAGEITPLTAMVRPHIAIVTNVEPVHLEFFENVEAIADAKAEIFSGLVPGGLAIINRDNEHYERLGAHARASGAGHIASFGEHEKADARLLNIAYGADHSIIVVSISGRRISYRLGAAGRHLAINSLAVLLAAKSLGIDLDHAAGALAFFEAPVGRGQRMTLAAEDGPFTLIDESYNANPASMRAALALVGALPAPESARRIAILGDMLELGEHSADLHANLVTDVLANQIDLVFAAGPLMKNLFDVLPNDVQAAWCEKVIDLEPLVSNAIRGGDIVVIKGSNGSRMRTIVNALAERFSSGDSV
jgi:UDP-N-acetylmuramoyl-tripeptide--D-alanyl-D-alanine ligase